MNHSRNDLFRLITGFQASQAIHAAATLRLADHLHHHPSTATEAAGAVGAHPDALHRLMRVLTAINVLRQDQDKRFTLTETGEYLRRDVKGSCAPMAELMGRQYLWQAWGSLLHSIRTGRTAFEYVHRCDVWDYRSRHPDDAMIFDCAMSSETEQLVQAVLAVCDFGRFEHIVDIGGGDGTFLAKIMERHAAVRGTVFDMPHVIARVAATADQFGNRFSAVAGDFFKYVPVQGDAYLLKWILHDWSDKDSIAILTSCRRAMKPSGRILVAEYILDAGISNPNSAFMDLNMMVMNGGRERTSAEFETLLSASGLKLIRSHPTSAGICILEAAPN